MDILFLCLAFFVLLLVWNTAGLVLDDQKGHNKYFHYTGIRLYSLIIVSMAIYLASIALISNLLDTMYPGSQSLEFATFMFALTVFLLMLPVSFVVGYLARLLGVAEIRPA